MKAPNFLYLQVWIYLAGGIDNQRKRPSALFATDKGKIVWASVSGISEIQPYLRWSSNSLSMKALTDGSAADLFINEKQLSQVS